MNLLFKRSAPFLALLGLALGGCQPDLEDSPKSSAGQADFSRYIAVGNSLTAGFGDGGPNSMGGLSLEGQLNSYPNILAGQFKTIGGGEFVQPLFSTTQANGSGFLKLTGFDTAGNPIIGFESANTASVPGSLTTRRVLLAKYTGPTNQNLGVPGIKVADVTTNGYGLNNPLDFNVYFERLLPSGAAGGASYLQYVTAQVAAVKPTFFTNWLGNNDVLSYATDGGVGSTLTPVADFTTKYNAVLDALTTNGAKGLVATIPNVTDVPLFTTVPVAAAIAGIKADTRIPNSAAASLYIRTGAGTVREATSADLLLLSARQAIGTVSASSPLPLGVGYSATQSNPLPSNFVLDDDEKKAVAARTIELNNVIKDAANRKNLALFDANAYFVEVARTGAVTNTVGNTAGYIAGNLFSLDGVHPTPRGYALIANEMIKVINAKYSAGIPGVDATRYRGVRFPQ
jgi:lysophospholipase L1-like esterase